MSYEEQMRREMEQAAKEQQVAPPECPVEETIDAAFAIGRRMTPGEAYKKYGALKQFRGKSMHTGKPSIYKAPKKGSTARKPKAV